MVVHHFTTIFAHSVRLGVRPLYGNWGLEAQLQLYLVHRANKALRNATNLGFDISWQHIDSHTGNYGNERADALADLGANGYYQAIRGLGVS